MRFTKILPEGKQIAKKLQSFFAKDVVKTLSVSSKFVQKESPLDGTHFVNLCIQGLRQKNEKGAVSMFAIRTTHLGFRACLNFFCLTTNILRT